VLGGTLPDYVKTTPTTIIKLTTGMGQTLIVRPEQEVLGIGGYKRAESFSTNDFLAFYTGKSKTPKIDINNWVKSNLKKVSIQHVERMDFYQGLIDFESENNYIIVDNFVLKNK